MRTPKPTNDFTDVIVIYNPKSTGPGKDMARQLKRGISKYAVRLVETKHAGHAEELAYEFAKTTPRPLIISASGDGGYHEVVNGLIRAQSEGAQPTAGLLPAGNANDHYHNVHKTDLAEAIAAGQVQRIDILKLTTTIGGEPFVRYAHSYIGFGLTPQVGSELNKVELHWFNEIWIVLKALFVLRPVRIIAGGKRRSYDSLIFSNVGKMSKVLSLSEHSASNDGKFEVTLFKRRNKLQLIKLLIKASTGGLAGEEQNESYTFRTIKSALVQADGEVWTVDADSEVVIGIEHNLLRCIV